MTNENEIYAWMRHHEEHDDLLKSISLYIILICITILGTFLAVTGQLGQLR